MSFRFKFFNIVSKRDLLVYLFTDSTCSLLLPIWLASKIIRACPLSCNEDFQYINARIPPYRLMCRFLSSDVSLEIFLCFVAICLHVNAGFDFYCCYAMHLNPGGSTIKVIICLHHCTHFKLCATCLCNFHHRIYWMYWPLYSNLGFDYRAGLMASC